MTMSEYEERFRSSTLSLHQTFAEARGPIRRGAMPSPQRTSDASPVAARARQRRGVVAALCEPTHVAARASRKRADLLSMSGGSGADPEVDLAGPQIPL
jgi:hypothetical protein